MQKEYDPEKRGGGVSWALLGGAILALEFRQETLSNSYARGVNHQLGKYAIRGLALYTFLHLENLLPDSVDLFDKTFEKVSEWASEGAHIP